MFLVDYFFDHKHTYIDILKTNFKNRLRWFYKFKFKSKSLTNRLSINKVQSHQYLIHFVINVCDQLIYIIIRNLINPFRYNVYQFIKDTIQFA